MTAGPLVPPATPTTRSQTCRGLRPTHLRAFGLLVIVVALLSIGNAFWLAGHFLTIPPPWDQAFYLYMGLRYLYALSDYGPIAMVREFIHLSPDVAPLFPLTSVPLSLVFGPSRLLAHLTNGVYLFLLLAGIYLLGTRIYGRTAGALAVFVMATFTATINYSRDYLLEFPAGAFVTLGVYAIVRSEEFRHRRWCVLAGVCAGLSVLTKTMTGVFFIGPVLFLVARLLKRRQLATATLVNCLGMIAIGFLVASVWWGPNFRTAFGYLIHYGFKEGALPYAGGGTQLLTLENLTYYGRHLVNYGTSFAYALLFAVVMLVRVGYALFPVRGKPHRIGDVWRDEGILWVWFLVGYMILTVVPNKGEERYAQLLLPPIALILSGGIGAIWHRGLKYGMIAVTLVVGGCNYVGLTFDLPSIPQRIYLSRLAILSREYPHYTWVRSKVAPDPDYRWPMFDIISLLTEQVNRHEAKVISDLRSQLGDRSHEVSTEERIRTIYRAVLDREPSEKVLQRERTALSATGSAPDALIDTFIASPEYRNHRSKVLVVPDHPQFNASTLRYYAEVNRARLSFSHILDEPITTRRLQEYKFILVKDAGYQGPEFSTRYTDQIYEKILQPDSGFIPLPGRFPFPDHSNIVIFVASSVLD